MGLSSPQNIRWMREAEIQHGRLCQLAWLGWVAVDLGIKFPGAKYAELTSFTAHDTVARYVRYPLSYCAIGAVAASLQGGLRDMLPNA